jgi:hypothetical protein
MNEGNDLENKWEQINERIKGFARERTAAETERSELLRMNTYVRLRLKFVRFTLLLAFHW